MTKEEITLVTGNQYREIMKDDMTDPKFFQDLLELQDSVILWNSIAGNEVSNKELIDTYWKLVKEESRELFTGEKDIDILDAIVDLGVVGLFHRAVAGQPIMQSDDIEFDQMAKECKCFDEAKDSLMSTIDHNDYYWFIYDWIEAFYAYSKSYDVIGAFREVMRSNFTKFTAKTPEEVEQEISYIVEQGRYSDITYKTLCRNGETFTIFYAGKDLREGVTFNTPKIVKSSTFEEPDLNKFV